MGTNGTYIKIDYKFKRDIWYDSFKKQQKQWGHLVRERGHLVRNSGTIDIVPAGNTETAPERHKTLKFKR